jgi:hypothetical protein
MKVNTVDLLWSIFKGSTEIPCVLYILSDPTIDKKKNNKVEDS